jgi:hypothetical protein
MLKENVAHLQDLAQLGDDTVLSDTAFSGAKMFTKLLYGESPESRHCMGQLRYEIFTRKAAKACHLPPTLDSLW